MAAQTEVPQVKFTVGNARKVSGFEVDSAVTNLRERNAGAQRVQGEIAHDAAIFTFWVTRTADMIGKGEDGKPAEGKAFATQGDYAEALGYSQSYGTLLKRLAVFAVEWKIAARTDQWRFLVQKGNDAKVARLLKSRDLSAEDGTPTEAGRAELDALVKSYRDGTFKGGLRGARPNDGTGTADRDSGRAGNGGDDSEGSQPEVRAMTAADAVSALDTLSKSLSDEAWADVRASLMAIVEREDQIRTERAESA